MGGGGGCGRSPSRHVAAAHAPAAPCIASATSLSPARFPRTAGGTSSGRARSKRSIKRKSEEYNVCWPVQGVWLWNITNCFACQADLLRAAAGTRQRQRLHHTCSPRSAVRLLFLVCLNTQLTNNRLISRATHSPLAASFQLRPCAPAPHAFWYQGQHGRRHVLCCHCAADVVVARCKARPERILSSTTNQVSGCTLVAHHLDPTMFLLKQRLPQCRPLHPGPCAPFPLAFPVHTSCSTARKLKIQPKNSSVVAAYLRVTKVIASAAAQKALRPPLNGRALAGNRRGFKR